MQTPHRLDFHVGVDHGLGDDRDALVVTPLVDGTSLVDLVGEFEKARGFDAAGGYAGLLPQSFRFGDLRGYFLGANDGQWPDPGHLWLLGCDCGELGCWPLEARVVPGPDTVTWEEFTQPHRGGRDYRGFGPFVFDRAQYDDAVATMADLVGTS